MSYILSCNPVLSLKSRMNLRVFRWFRTMQHQFRDCSIIFFSLLVGTFLIFRAGTILGMDEVRFSPSWRIGRSSCMTNGSVGYGGGFRHGRRKLQSATTIFSPLKSFETLFLRSIHDNMTYRYLN